MADWVITALRRRAYDQFVADPDGTRYDGADQMSSDRRSLMQTEPGRCVCPRLSGARRRARATKGSAGPADSAVHTVSTAFMGMTVGCAKCHDHMYDPISQRITTR